MAERVVTVETAFDITRRGVAVVFDGDATGLPFAQLLDLRIDRPHRDSIEAKATVELLLNWRPQPVERAVLLIVGRTKSEVPVGSRITITVP